MKFYPVPLNVAMHHTLPAEPTYGMELVSRMGVNATVGPDRKYSLREAIFRSLSIQVLRTLR